MPCRWWSRWLELGTQLAYLCTGYGIRYRQLAQWIRGQESMQLFKRPAKVKTYRSFILPSTVLKTLFIDALDLGRWSSHVTFLKSFV